MGDDRNIRIAFLNNDNDELLIYGPGDQEYPKISPDSRYVAYQSDETGDVRVMVFDRETNFARDVLEAGATRPAWTRDGKSMYYIRDGNLYRKGVQTAKGFSMTGQERLIYEDGYTFYYDEMPDGRIVIAREADRNESTLNITLNWTERLKAAAGER